MLTAFKFKDFTHLKSKLGLAKSGMLALHFAASTVKLVKVVECDGHQELDAAIILDLPQELRDYAWLDSAVCLAGYMQANIDKAMLAATQAVAIIEQGHSYLKELQMPLLSADELKQAVQWDALQHLPYTDGEYSYDYLYAKWENANGEGLKVSLLAIEQKLSQAILLVCSELNIALEQVLTSSLALREFIRDSYKHFAIVDIGWEDTQIAIFDTYRPVYQAAINMGKKDQAKAIAELRNISLMQAKALLDSHSEFKAACRQQPTLEAHMQQIVDDFVLQLSLKLERYIVNQGWTPLEAVILSWAAPSLRKELLGAINSQLNTHSESIRPFEMFTISDKLNINSQDEQFSIALGAVLFAAREQSFSIVPLGAAKSSGRSKLYRLLVAIVTCLVLGISSYEFVLLHLSQREYRQLGEQYSMIAVWRQRHDLIQSLEADCQKREQIVRQLNEQRTAWPQILLALGYNIPDGVSITSISKVKDDDNYLLRGKTDNMGAVSEFIIALQKTKIFKSIKLQQIGESNPTSNTGEFLINLKGIGKGYAAATDTMGEIQ